MRYLCATIIAAVVLVLAPAPASSTKAGMFNPHAQIDRTQIIVPMVVQRDPGAVIFSVFVP